MTNYTKELIGYCSTKEFFKSVDEIISKDDADQISLHISCIENDDDADGSVKVLERMKEYVSGFYN